MLTDIFAYRYSDQAIWSTYTEIEQRLLNQAFGVVKDALPYWIDEKEDEKQKAKWRQIHDQLARVRQFAMRPSLLTASQKRYKIISAKQRI